MVLSQKQWRNYFLFSLGVFLGTTFCMKWLETRFYYQGELFTIIGLEISYPAERVMDILYQSGAAEQTLLKAHLFFDFVFMAGAYGGILSLLMMARSRLHSQWFSKVLGILAVGQLIAWGCDIRENMYLLDWLRHKPDLRPYFSTYHFVVIVKWVLALSGSLLSIPVLLLKRK